MTVQLDTLNAIMQAFVTYPELKPLVKYKLNNQGIENVEIANETLRSTKTEQTADLPGVGPSSSGSVPHEAGAGDVRDGCAGASDPAETKIEEVIFSDFNKQ